MDKFKASLMPALSYVRTRTEACRRSITITNREIEPPKREKVSIVLFENSICSTD